MPTEISIANDGANETVTIKKRLRVKSFHVVYGENVTFNSEKQHIDNADEVVRKVIGLGPTVWRPIEASLAETVSISGTPYDLALAIKIFGKFHDKWKAEDILAQTPPP